MIVLSAVAAVVVYRRVQVLERNPWGLDSRDWAFVAACAVMAIMGAGVLLLLNLSPG